MNVCNEHCSGSTRFIAKLLIELTCRSGVGVMGATSNLRTGLIVNGRNRESRRHARVWLRMAFHTRGNLPREGQTFLEYCFSEVRCGDALPSTSVRSQSSACHRPVGTAFKVTTIHPAMTACIGRPLGRMFPVCRRVRHRTARRHRHRSQPRNRPGDCPAARVGRQAGRTRQPLGGLARSRPQADCRSRRHGRGSRL